VQPAKEPRVFFLQLLDLLFAQPICVVAARLAGSLLDS
jgi:hypothetical protein